MLSGKSREGARALGHFPDSRKISWNISRTRDYVKGRSSQQEPGACTLIAQDVQSVRNVVQLQHVGQQSEKAPAQVSRGSENSRVQGHACWPGARGQGRYTRRRYWKMCPRSARWWPARCSALSLLWNPTPPSRRPLPSRILCQSPSCYPFSNSPCYPSANSLAIPLFSLPLPVLPLLSLCQFPCYPSINIISPISINFPSIFLCHLPLLSQHDSSIGNVAGYVPCVRLKESLFALDRCGGGFCASVQMTRACCQNSPSGICDS